MADGTGAYMSGRESSGIFIGGLHGSGADLLPALLAQHSQIAAMGAAERSDQGEGRSVSRGEFHQTVFEPDGYYGGPGAFAFHPGARADPDDDRWAEADLARFRADFERHWTGTDALPVQHSPANVVRARFIAEAFPESVQLYVHRHPVLDALRTRERTDDRSQPVGPLVRHWLRAHEQLLQDLQGLENCFVVPFDTLRRRPNEVLTEVFEAAGLEPEPIDATGLRSVGREGWAAWRESPPEDGEPVRSLESEIRRFGYSLENPTPAGQPAVEEILRSPTPVERLRPDGYDLPRAREEFADESAGEPPRRLMLVSFGSRADVEPLVAFARALDGRGYDVTLLSTSEHRDLAERHGVPFVSPHSEATLDVPTALDGQGDDAFFTRLAEFYHEHGTDIIGTVAARIEGIDCVVLGRGVFFRGLLRDHYGVETVDVQLAPPSVEGGLASDRPGVPTAFREMNTRRYGKRNFRIDDALDRAYEACGIDYRCGANRLVGSIPRLVETLRLRAYSPRVDDGDVPGIPGETTGFWRLEDTYRGESPTAASDGGVSGVTPESPTEIPPAHATALDSDTQSFLESGRAPVCLAFGDRAVGDRPPWMGQLLDALERSDHRVLAVGPSAPEGIDGAHRVERVPFEAVFPYCRAVVHHGDARATAACLRAATPAIVVPPATPSGVSNWAAWVEREGAGIQVTDPDRFEEHLDRIDDEAVARRAATVGEQLTRENGVERAVAAFEDHFQGTDPALVARREAIRYIESLPITSRRRLALAGLVLLSERGARAGETVQRRDACTEAIEGLSRETPIFERDWPRKGEPVELDVHDLPHDSSGAERWSFHGHLETESGRELSLFSVLFERAVRGTRLGHVNAGVVDVDRDKSYTRAISDPRTPETLAPELADAPATDYFTRALHEVYQKGESPAPDRLADEPAEIGRDEYNYSLGDLEIEKRGGGYRLSLAPEDGDGLGFELRFVPEKKPTPNYEDGITPGVTDEASSFHYSITRMAVTGHVVLDGERERVSGSGWYDHEFGGGEDTTAALGGLHSRTRHSIQFDDGSDLVYTTLTDRDTGERVHEDSVVFVDPDGNRAVHTGELRQTRTWSSLRTFTEYGVEWELSVPALDLELHVEGVRDSQEIQTLVASPAYWEGRVTVEGQRAGEPVTGTGICEQYGQGGDRSHYRSFLEDVSREVQRSVRELLPRESLSEAELVELVASEEQAALAEGVDREAFTASIVDPIRQLVDRGGKGWRSMCAVLCADVAGGETQQYRSLLAIPELVHSGSLMVDDIQDNSESRRGGPAIHREFGEARTINAGTMSYFLGYESMLEELGVSDEQWLRAYRLHNLMMRAAHTGQGLDIHGLQHRIDGCIETGEFEELWENLRAVHVLKSAVPAMIAARMGVVIAGGDRDLEDTIGEYFKTLGLAFQIVDDAINLRGFEHDLKEHAEDLAEGKVTAPIVRAFEQLEEPEQRELAALLDEPDEREIRRILDLVEGCGAVDWCHEHARDLVEEAWKPVDEALPESQSKMMLRAFSWFVVDIRDY